MKSYSRNLKYLAEDWAPVGVPLPEVLTKGPGLLEDENVDFNAKIVWIFVR